MSLLFGLLLSLNISWAAEIEWAVLPRPVPVFAQAAEGAQMLLITEPGERIAIRSRGNTYTRVQVRRGGKWKAGYIFTTELENTEAKSSRGSFGIGGGGIFSYLRHSGKSFSTDDEVKYTTAQFTSTSFSPFLAVQYGEEDFWRFIFTYRMTNYSSTAMTDVPGATKRDLSLQHTMLSATLQRMWTPFTSKVFYYGLGLEASRATEATLKLGNNKLPVNKQDLPAYIGGHAAGGGQFNLGPSLSAFSELRLVGYFNQSPMIFGVEVAAGLLYWP